MSKSLDRVNAALLGAGLDIHPVEARTLTRTAAEAAVERGCEIDQIGKSIVFSGAESSEPLLFLTAGGRRVNSQLGAALARETLVRADAATIRKLTGFAIGGVSPVGHLTRTRAWIDRRLLDFDIVWCAAGTPRHNFAIAPKLLVEKFGLIIADFAESGS